MERGWPMSQRKREGLMNRSSIPVRHGWPIALGLIGLAMGGLVLGGYPLGMLEARRDLLWGRYEIRVSGYPAPGVTLAALILPQEHGIRVRWGGCLAGPWRREYVRGYNTVAFPAIERRWPGLLALHGFR